MSEVKGEEPKVDYYKDLTPEQRAKVEHCQLFLENEGNGFYGLVNGHQIQLAYSGGGYRGFVDGNKPLTSEQAQDLYVEFFPITNAQTRQRFSKIRENNPETDAVVKELLTV